MHPDEQHRLLEAVATLTRAAGEVIMDIYHSDFAVRGKSMTSTFRSRETEGRGGRWRNDVVQTTNF